MKSFIILGFILTLSNCGSSFRHFRLGKNFQKEKFNSENADEYEIKWFTQKLDHSDPTNLRTWQQKYLVNKQYFNETRRSVIFLNIGGESPASSLFMTNGAWIEFAQHFEALAIQVEHRFYGKSQPTGDASISSYKYFTSEQALSDLAEIIQSLNPTFEHPPQWIIFGGSYAGSLAAWLRLRYPHLVKGSVSTSGPLLAKLDFYEYYQVVAQDLKDVSEECYNIVKEGSNKVEEMVENDAGRQELTKLFKLCEPLDNDEKNILNFIDATHSNFAGIAQYNKDNQISATEERKNFTLDSLCDILTDETEKKNEVEKLAELNEVLLNLDSVDCVNVNYKKLIDGLKDYTDVENNGRAWFFQTCNEFGWYPSPHKAEIFGKKDLVDFYILLCQETFGSAFNRTTLESNIQRSNTIYGALSNVIDNVVYVHGSVDPWHKMGIIKSANNHAPAIYIEGTAHCADFYPSSSKDLPELTEARKRIQQLIQLWLH